MTAVRTTAVPTAGVATRRPVTGWIVGLLVALVVVGVAGICLGSVALPLRGVLAVLGVRAGLPVTTTVVDDYVVWQLRVPRVLLAAIVGAGLALSGTALQGLVRNPLADPYVLGVSAGASFGAVLVMTVGSGVLLGVPVTSAAFVGAVLVLAAVYVFAQRGGAFTDSRLVLAGVALGYVAMAATSFVQLSAAPGEIRGILFWTLGSVAGARWDGLVLPLVVLVLAGGWLLTRARALNALALGDDDAIAVGVDLRAFRLALLLVASVLTATAVAVAGGVGFVGLIVPHAVRLVVGGDHRRLLPVAALAGAVLLVGVDLLARTVGSPNEYPLTLFTALVGGPFFLWLMRGSRGEV